MATRREVSQQRLALSRALREQCRSGRLLPGEPAPPLRQLAEDFGISTRVANQVLQDLIQEGLFHMVPRVGTFVGRPKGLNDEFYLMLLPDEYGLTTRDDLNNIQHGFEERIADKGSASLVMPLHKALECRQKGEMPPLAGLFDLSYHHNSPASWGAQGALARVSFSGRNEDVENSDEVSYDNEGGGRLATRHLIDQGHRNIAFLALHSEQGPIGELIWSRERVDGWRQMLQVSGLRSEGLLFQPRLASCDDRSEQTRIGRELGQQILARPEITAVVAANDFVAAGLLQAARENKIVPERWPSVVGFDNRASANGHLITSLRLPGEQLGRAAADLLLERRMGQITEKAIHRRVAMQLIPRLTSRRDWSLVAGSAMLTTTGTATT